MKNLLRLIFLLSISFLISCTRPGRKDTGKSEKVVISGKVLHLNKDKKTLTIQVNKAAFDPEIIPTDIDRLGNFSVSFRSYIPSDVYIEYARNFYIITHPGDSIHMVFEGSKNNLLKTIRFSGDASKSNQDLAAFQQIYYSNSLNTDYNPQIYAIKNYDTGKYWEYCDSVRAVRNKTYKKFAEKYSPDDETKNWIQTFLKNDFYYSVAWYPVMHKQVNHLKQFNVNPDYYNKLNEMLPVKRSMLISTAAVNTFINYYYFFNVLNKVKDRYGKNISDSLLTAEIMKLIPDALMRQLVLTYKYGQDLNFMEVAYFKKHKKEINGYIKESFLRRPLYSKYEKVNNDLNNPRISANAAVNNNSALSEKEIMNRILAKNKGKVIYLDFWATWCGPCLAELPRSKKLMSELKDGKVVFVYVCIDSEIKDWKAMLSKYQLGGQHYFLDKKQSREFRKAFNIIGIPDYLLINKKGSVVEKGSYLRPDNAKGKIKLLL